MTDEPNRDENEIPPAFSQDMTFAEMDLKERMRWVRKKTIEHLWGPTGSVILHVILIFLALRYFTLPSRDLDLEVEVKMMEMRETNLDEIQKELEQLQELDPEFERPDMDVAIDPPPDDQPFETQERMEDFAALDIRTDVQSHLVMRGLFSGRTEAGRAASLRRFAGRYGDATNVAVRRALDWLRDAQLPDGSWSGTGSAVSKTAMTGLALLTFLSHGETHRSERYGETVRKAIVFLVEQDLRADGQFTHADAGMYAHGIAAYALSEAFALTRIVSIKPAMELAIGRIVRGQQPTGAFNYGLRTSDTRRDTSVAAWMAQAMKGAFLAGADVPGLREAMDLAIAGFKRNFDTSNNMFAYAPGAAPDDQGGGDATGSPNITPYAVLALQLLGRGRDAETVSGLRTLDAWQVDWNERHPSSWPLYTWYYATQAIFHGGGNTWDRWNAQFARMMIENQNADGSWSPTGRNEAPYGPVYGTTFSALSLMVYYRFLPTYQPIEAAEPATEIREGDVEIDVL